MARQAIEFEQRRVGQRADLIDAGEVRNHGAGADIDEDLAGLDRVASDLDRVGRDEPRVAVDHGAVLRVAQPGLEARALAADNPILSRHDGGEIDGDGPRADAEIGGAAR